MYKVIEYFTDLHDKDHPYNVGDTFPRKGITVTDERLKELAGSSNRRGIPLIALVEDEQKPADEKPKKAPAKKATTPKAKKTAEE